MYHVHLKLCHSRILNGGFFLVVITFIILRLVNINADFPSGITWSGVLYSDEGWYANAAVRSYTFGNWYLAGDFNPAINMPLGQLLHLFTFSLLGLSLSSVRITSIVIYAFLVLITARLVHQEFDSFTAILTALILVTNYMVFAFSRLAIMELIAAFFIVSGIFVAQVGCQKEKRDIIKLLLASALIGAGILTKPTMVFATPLLIYFAWQYGEGHRERFKLFLTSLIVLLFIVGAYQAVATILFPKDYVYFSQLNIQGRIHQSLTEWFLNIPLVIVGIKTLGVGFVGCAFLITVAAFITSDNYRKHLLTQVMLGYIATYIALLSLVRYEPPRYYLPLIVPLAVLSATACRGFLEKLYKTKQSRLSLVYTLPLIIMIGISLNESGKVVSYLSHPSFSFYHMAKEVGNIIQAREGDASQIVLFGNIADSVAIEAGVRSVNTMLGTHTLNRKLREYRPHYVLLHTDEEVLTVVEANGGHVTKLASWDVYNNYYGSGQKVQLMYVQWE